MTLWRHCQAANATVWMLREVVPMGGRDPSMPVLEKAHQWMQNHKAELLPREATDCGGWGSYDGAVSFLGEIVAACRRHPKGYLYISY